MRETERKQKSISQGMGPIDELHGNHHQTPETESALSTLFCRSFRIVPGSISIPFRWTLLTVVAIPSGRLPGPRSLRV